MLKYFNKIILGMFMLLAVMFSGNVFANDFIADIVILGGDGVGKTALRKHLLNVKIDAKRVKTTEIGYIEKILQLPQGDSVLCTLWDTPVFDSIEDQLKATMVKKADVVFIVVDCHSEHDKAYFSIMHETMCKYITMINAKFPSAQIIVVANKMDLLSDEKIAEFRDTVDGARHLAPQARFDCVLTSLKDKTGRDELERALLSTLEGKCHLRPLDEAGSLCEACADRCPNNAEFPGYCSYRCKLRKEGIDCKGKRDCGRRFLKTEPHYGEYCTHACKLQHEGIDCKGKKDCGKRFLSDEPHYGEYCTRDCKVQHEAKKCKYAKCPHSFLVGEGYDDDYCSIGCQKADRSPCVIM